MLKTISASFDTVDLAELAAKQIKQHFDNVKAITIKYRNFPEMDSRRTDSDSPLVYPAATAASSTLPGTGTGNSAFPAFFPAPYYHEDSLNAQNHSGPEIEQSTESRLIIKATGSEAAKIESQLRGLGGREIISK